MAEHSRGRQLVLLATRPRYHVAKLLELNEVITVRDEEVKPTNEINLKIVKYRGTEYHAVIFDSGDYPNMEIAREKLVDYERSTSRYRSFSLTSQAVQTEIDLAITGEPTQTHPFRDIRSALDSLLEQPHERFGNLGWESASYDEDFSKGDDYMDVEPSYMELSSTSSQVQSLSSTSLTEQCSNQPHRQEQSKPGGPSTSKENVAVEIGVIDPAPEILPHSLPVPGGYKEQSKPGGPSTSKENVAVEIGVIDPAPEILPDILAVPGGYKGENKKEKKNRPQFCIYCRKQRLNLPRHLVLVHMNEELVKEYKQLQNTKDKGMYEVLARIRRLGNAEFNKLQLAEGLPVEGVRSSTVEKSDMKACPNCGAFYKKRTLSRHFRACSGKPVQKNFTSIVEGTERLRKADVPVEMSKELREKIIPGMRIGPHDDTVDTIINDEDLIALGNNLVLKFGHELANQKKLIRRKLRAMASLKIAMAKEDPTIRTVRDIFDTDRWEIYINAVQKLAKLKSHEEESIAPNVVNELGLLATNVARNVRVSLPKTKIGDEWKKNIEDWLDKHEVQFGATIGYQARKMADRKKWRKRKYEPMAKDITLLNNYIRGAMTTAMGILETDFDMHQWEELNKATMLILLIFNRKRSGEVHNMKLSDYQRKQKVRKDTDIYKTLTESEKMLAGTFYHVEIRGKLARAVPILIEHETATAIDLLISFREEAGIPPTNDYLFAKGDGHLDASLCLSEAANLCGAEVPRSLTSTRLRKHIATVSQALKLTDTDLKTLAGFMGHTTKTHLENYRLPSDAVHTAKLSKLLLALDQGTISKFRGRAIEEIDVSTTVEEIEEDVGIITHPSEDPADVSLPRKITTPKKKKLARPSPSPLKSPIKLSPAKLARRKWTPQEVQAMETEFAEYLKEEKLPGTTFCNEVRKRCNVLSTRKAALLRAWINNAIVRRKRIQKKRLF